MLVPLVAVLALTLMQGPQAPVPANDVAVVRALYAAAAYEEVLAHLTKVDPTKPRAELEQYRALCLFALGRGPEGLEAFEKMVRIAPLYVIPEADISPRLLTSFQETRRRVLPTVVRDLYARGKASFDAKRFGDAVTELRDVRAVLADPDLASQAASFTDLRQLADGFLALAELEQTRAAAPPPVIPAVVEAPPPPAPAPPPVASAPVNPAPAASSQVIVTRIVVYSRDDADVKAPVEVERFMPPWTPPATAARTLEYRGTLEVVIDEAGRVQEARMDRPTETPYDVSLVAATRRWRFEPARRGNEPVKYRMSFEIVLAPRR